MELQPDLFAAGLKLGAPVAFGRVLRGDPKAEDGAGDHGQGNSKPMFTHVHVLLLSRMRDGQAPLRPCIYRRWGRRNVTLKCENIRTTEAHFGESPIEDSRHLFGIRRDTRLCPGLPGHYNDLASTKSQKATP